MQKLILKTAVWSLVFLSGLVQAVRGQEEVGVGANTEYREVVENGWGVYGYANGRQRGYYWYENRSDADRARQKMLTIMTDKGKYYDRVEIKAENRTVRKPMRVASEDRVDTRPNTKAGDVLREYKNRIEQAYNNAKHLKDGLTKNTASATERQLSSVNAQIDAYNKYRDEVRVSTGFYFNSAPQLAKIESSPLLKPQQGNETNRTGTDASVNGRMKFVFYDSIAKTEREYGNLDDAKSALRSYAAKMAESYQYAVCAVYIETENGARNDQVYHIDCVHGRMTEDDEAIQSGLSYLSKRGN